MMRVYRREFLSSLGAMAAMSASRRALSRYALESGEDLRVRLAADPLRPQFHLLPARNWMNDPNGPIYWAGRYHMFFQYNPNAAVWGDMHWAHSVSPDMIHWKHMPVALAPTPGGNDRDGCFSGSAVDDHGTPTILYTGVASSAPAEATLRDGVHNFREVQCLATSADTDLRTWTKRNEPVLVAPAEPLLTGFRDPFLWRNNDQWYLGVGSGRKRHGGRVLLYRSSDLRAWKALPPLAWGTWNGKEGANPVDSGEMWECPDFFALGKKHVLLYSTEAKVYWETGELDEREMKFHAVKRGLLDHGSFYAPKTQLDAKGNRILWGWVPETRPEAEYSAAGWAGCMSLPRELSVAGDGELAMRAAPQTEMLRGKMYDLPDQAATAQQRLRWLREMRIESLAGEMEAIFERGRFGLALTDGAEWSLRFSYDPGQESKELQVNEARYPVPTENIQLIKLRVLVDGSVGEIFLNESFCLTARIYKKARSALRLEATVGELERLKTLRIWQMRPISSDRLTS